MLINILTVVIDIVFVVVAGTKLYHYIKTKGKDFNNRL